MSETVAGASVGLATWLLGAAVGTAMIFLWIIGTWAWGAHRKLARSTQQAGFTLVEVLVSLTLMVVVVAPIFDAIIVNIRIARSAQLRVGAVAIAREALAQSSIDAANAVSAGLSPNSNTRIEGIYQVQTTFTAKGSAAWWVEVRVTCPTCGSSSRSIGTVSLSGVVSP